MLGQITATDSDGSQPLTKLRPTLHLSLVGYGMRLGLLLVVTANALLLARALGPHDFGVYFLFLRMVSIMAALADLGISQSANAFFGRYKQWRSALHRIILRFVLLFWLGMIIIGGTTLWAAREILVPNFPLQLIIMAFAILPLSLYANLWNSMMIGMGKIVRVNLVQLIICALSLCLTLVFVVGLSGRVMTAAVIYLVMMAIQFLIMFVSASPNEEGAKDETPERLSRQVLNFGLRGYMGSLSYLLWSRLLVFILNAKHGIAAVGIFSISQQVVEKLLLLPVQAAQDAIYQRMSVLSPERATLAMNRYLRLTWWSMVLISLLGVLLAPSAVVMLLGEIYANTAEVIRILLIGTAFMGVSLLLDTYFINQLHRPGLVSILAWINTLAGVLFALMLISRGAVGAAWVQVLTYIVGTLVYLGLYFRISRTKLQQLIFIRGADMTLIREQMETILRWREGRG